MPVFNYEVRDPKSGKVSKGKLSAENMTLVRQRLQESGLLVLQIREQSALAAFGDMNIGGGKVKRKDVAIFARQFATMIEAGLPITKSLTILISQTENATLKSTIQTILADVESGFSISDAIARHPKVFPKIFVSMVRAGEAGGVLDEVLNRLADHFENELDLIGKIKSAVTYPIVMGALVFAIALAMLIFIVPVFQKMFEDAGAKLPLITQVMMAASKGLLSWKGPTFFIVLFIIIWLVNRWRKGTGVLLWDTFILKAPIVGPIILKMSLSRFSRTFSTLVSAGVPMLTSLDIVAETAGNEAIARVVLQARENVKEGNPLAQPFAQSKLFPAMLSQMIAVGEETGALDVMLKKISEFYDAEVSSAVDSLSSALEPVMMGMLGGVVGVMVIGLYLPMFQMVSVIK